ncbi:MAG: 2'-5' RNA ligase family protein [Patescibacteria group bacterium]|nr:2'-5' RNA ligase family protein [Patescibacteria group bacterium]
MALGKEVAANQFPQVYQDLGIDPNKLGCIMLNTEPIEISNVIQFDDLYFSDPLLHPHTQGIICEDIPHVTLLYGLLRSGLELKKHVDALLEGWEPADPTIREIGFFPGEDENNKYITLVAKLEASPNLLDANSRLRLLPHCDTHQTYQPHITLAYISDSSDYQGYIRTLNHMFMGMAVRAANLNYGD